MSLVSKEYQLPLKIRGFLKRILINYQSSGDNLLHKAVESSSIRIHECWHEYDNFDYTRTGHAITFYIKENVIASLGNLHNQKKLQDRILEDLNLCCEGIPTEYIHAVFFEVFDKDNSECRKAIYPFEGRPVQTDTGNIWSDGYVRLFISHRDAYKNELSLLKTELEKYGVSCFVAHDSIKPLSEWQEEIEKALFSMDALLVYLTDDFNQSDWTDQEVGVAIGRNIPVIPVKVEKRNPHGFLSKFQALKARRDETTQIANAIFQELANSLPKSGLVKDGVIEAFVKSGNFDQGIFIIKNLLPKISKLEAKDISKIEKGFAENDQLHKCLVVCKELPALLKRHSKQHYEVKGGRLVKATKN